MEDPDASRAAGRVGNSVAPPRTGKQGAPARPGALENLSCLFCSECLMMARPCS